ncbi:unnamed protein product [Vitrella brassicaformis CCMP3155]|uniref:Uncharacterized protein n=1 Tax=Vitrella brassicaformis (strain CCMP3155) TaxID=1169540 RepID=A0A0G4EEX3_VITBC|nr:unnamed protein product [Vitrella brassicaformis CCMP3155]|eukprot:CEL93931.1 unnamed protein product [Vitrella brassicaformis CCMP3155]
MSEGHDDIHMASAAMADGDGGDADDVAEEDSNGGGEQPDGQDDNDADSDLLREEEDGGMAEEEEGVQEAADSESESGGVQDDSDGDGGPLGDGIDDDDESDEDDGYEEDGHPVEVATTVEVPDGCWRSDDIEARFPHYTNEATRQLALGIIGRTITSPQQATRLIQQNADPDVMPRLRQKGSGYGDVYGYPLLCLAIDNKSDYTAETILAGDSLDCRLFALPHWSSDELQSAIITALLDRGADVNAAADETGETPLHLAIACGNQTAFDLLMARHDVDLRPADAHAVRVMELPEPLRPPPPEYLQLLMSMYERLIARDPTLATQRRGGLNLVFHAAGSEEGHYPQWFIDAYLDLVTANGADMTADDAGGETPLHRAAFIGSPHVADYLCRKLPADQINRRTVAGNTPLAIAAYELDRHTQHLQHPNTSEADKEEVRAEIPNYKLTIRSLLRVGADISTIPTATEERRRQLVLTEYAGVLNELGPPVMAAVNAALAPHRSLAALLTPRLAVGPQEAPVFGWRIASYLFDMNAAQEVIGEAIGVRHTDMARRVCAAAEHFIHSAVYQASSNREVVGGMRYEQQGDKRLKVTVPQLQCFVVGGVGGRKMELREVVQRAILDEAAKWGRRGRSTTASARMWLPSSGGRWGGSTRGGTGGRHSDGWG